MLYETELLQDRKICIDLSESSWGLLKDNHFIAINDSKSCVALYPLLERNYDEVKKAISDINDLLEIKDIFPYELLLISSLEYPTSYWPSMAVSWLEKSGLKSNKIQQRLFDMKDDKNYEQKLRHRVKKLLKHW